MTKHDEENIKICVVGLGYVGLPLSLYLGKHFPVVGFDVNEKRVLDLTVRCDTNNEYTREEIGEFKWAGNTFTCLPDESISKANFIIVTVPTPITKSNTPDLRPLESASRLIGDWANPSAKPIVVFESTVYPGVTEEVCVPIIEEASDGTLKCGENFFVGYSPERVNPGDTVNTIDKITKIVAGMDNETVSEMELVYGSFTKTHMAQTIKVAEAAKVIENAQRDLNIAFVNELSLIFDKLGIDTLDVLEAAGTKWNFLPFKPGLVGGHCISVDPYYLTHKAQIHGFPSQVIAAGRRINDSMAHHVVELVTRGLNSKKLSVNGSEVLILGATFKPNCKDTRNSKIGDVVHELEDMGAYCEIYDPFYETKEIPGFNKKIGTAKGRLSSCNPDIIVYAVDHEEFRLLDWYNLMENNPAIVDLHGKLGKARGIYRL